MQALGMNGRSVTPTKEVRQLVSHPIAKPSPQRSLMASWLAQL
jgi:hypothetical protein